MPEPRKPFNGSNNIQVDTLPPPPWLPADRFPHLAAVAGHFADADADERFELLIDIFVSGLAQRARE